MKKLFILSVIALTVCSIRVSAWGTIGHAAVAQIAENHLSGHTKKALKKHLKGTDIVEISSYPDKYYYQWYRDIGWECSNPKILRRKPSEMDVLPSNLEPWCHSFTVDSLYNVYRHNREGEEYIRNCIMDLDWLIHNLKDNLSVMDQEEKLKQLALVVHLLGDMHCPMHVLYVPQSPTGGKYSLVIDGEKINIHSFWDTRIWRFLNKDWSYAEFAEAADTASPEEIEEIAKGDVFDWGKASAISAFPAHHLTNASGEQRELDRSYPESMRWLAYQQIRNAGYRLAQALEYIFEE